MYNVQTLVNRLASVFHGTTVNKIPNLYGNISAAAATVLLDIDPKETQRITPLSPVFDNVYDYPLPSDVKGDRIIDIRKQANVRSSDQFTQSYGNDFNSSKSSNSANKMYTQWDTGVKSIRIEASNLKAPTVVTGTGTISGWTVSSGTPTIDTTNYVAGSGAIVFNAISGTTTASYTTTTATDLTSYKGISNGFYWIYLPSAITSITTNWGSDSSNYYTVVSTSSQDGTSFETGWNLIALPWSANTTSTGTPVVNSIKYINVSVNSPTAQTGMKLCNFTFNLEYIYEIVYYSKFLFRDPSTNAFQESITSSSDNSKLINLDTESYNILFNKCAYYLAQSLQGANAEYDVNFWDNEYQSSLKRYKNLNPAESLIKSTSYYPLIQSGIRNTFRGGFWY